MRRRRRAGEIEHLIDFGAAGAQAGGQGLDHIRIDHVEAWLALQMAKVLLPAGLKIVESDNMGAFGQEGVAQVRS